MRQYHALLAHVLEHGTVKADRTGTGTRSVFGWQMRFPLADGFPLVTTKKLHLRSIVHELLWFLRGETNIAYLRENKVSIWDEWADADGELGNRRAHAHDRAACPVGHLGERARVPVEPHAARVVARQRDDRGARVDQHPVIAALDFGRRVEVPVAVALDRHLAERPRRGRRGKVSVGRLADGDGRLGRAALFAMGREKGDQRADRQNRDDEALHAATVAVPA